MRSEGANQRGKHIFERTQKARGPDGPIGWSDNLQGRGGLSQRIGPVGPVPRKKSNGN
jgi:hypothetical protein